MNRIRTRPDYDTDFAAWADAQARAVREKRLDDLDLPHIAEELEGLSGADRREIENRLTQLLMHLLKYRYQPARRSRSWVSSIATQRTGIARVVRTSPSLARHPRSVLVTEYADARRLAAIQTGLPEPTFPATCPFTIDQILSHDWLPD